MTQQYGEPWRVTDTRIMSGDNRVVLETNDPSTRDRLFRIVAEHNCLAGIPDSALDKVRELVEACREQKQVFDAFVTSNDDSNWDAVQKAGIYVERLSVALGQLLSPQVTR